MIFYVNPFCLKVFANIGMDYGDICDRITKNGEPGFAWLDNMQQFSRLGDAPVLLQ